jgi:hypothetical protein
MYAFGAKGDRKHTLQNTYIPGEYLRLRDEPREVRVASRGTYGFRNRYLLKRRVMRTIRRQKNQPRH